MGVELELGVLLVIQLLASQFFARFEVEAPVFRKIVKWLIIDGLTVGLYFLVHHWAVVFPIVGLIPGTIYHFRWCRKNGIDPLRGTPRKKYYTLRGWKWDD